MKKIPAKNLMVLAVFGVALVSCGGDSSSSETSGGDTAVTTETASADPTTTVASDASGSTTSLAAPSTTATTLAPKVLRTECLLPLGESDCMKEVELFEDAGCPNPKADDLMATRTAILPCEYGFWVLMAEDELARQGYAVSADGYYSSTEIPAVKKAQADAGVEADGQIGPATWDAVMIGLHCDAPADVRAPILEGDLCWGDMNGNRMYDPGDMLPD